MGFLFSSRLVTSAFLNGFVSEIERKQKSQYLIEEIFAFGKEPFILPETLTSIKEDETELLVLAKLIRRPIMVYLPAHMAKNAASGSGYVCIQTYGEEYASKMNKKTGKVTERAPVRLLYNGQTHYDLLI